MGLAMVLSIGRISALSGKHQRKSEKKGKDKKRRKERRRKGKKE